MGNQFVQPSLTGGELSPQLYGRVDIARYQVSLKQARNFVVKPYGGLQNRAGFKYIASAKKATKRCRLIPFQFNNTQSYVLEFGDGYMRVFKDGGQVLLSSTPSAWLTATEYNRGNKVSQSGVNYYCVSAHTSGTFATDLAAGKWYALTGSIVEIPTDYLEADLPLLKYTQAADTVTIVHPNYPPAVVSRTAHDAWDWSAFGYKEGPFLDVNVDTASSVYASALSGNGVTITATKPIFTSGTVGRLFYIEQKNFGEPWAPGKTVAVDEIRRSDGKYYRALTAGTTGTNAPISIDDEWWDGGVNWIYLTSGYGICKITAVAGNALSATVNIIKRLPDGGTMTGFGASKTISAIAAVTSGGVHYWSLTSAGHGLTIGETRQIYVEVQFTGATFSLQPRLDSPLRGTGTCTVIDANTIYLWSSTILGNDFTRTFIVAGGTFTSGIFQTSSTTSASATYKWALGAWGGDQGWPSSVCYHQQRQVFGGTPAKPQTIWTTKTGDYTNFGFSTPLADDDGVTFSIGSNRLDAIKGIIPLQNLLIFTTGGQWMIGTGDADVLTPSNIGLRNQGFWGANDLPPIGVGTTCIFAQTKGSVIRDMGYDFAANGYNGGDLTVFSNHLFDGYSISEWAFQQHPNSCVWAVRNDGKLLSMTYLKEQQVLGWCPHDTTNGVIESACVVPEGNDDALYLSVKRTVNGSAVRYIERMATRLVTDIEDAFFVDSGLSFNGTNTTATTMTVSGGTAWDYTESLTLTASAATFTVGTSDVGDVVVLTSADGTRYRCTVSSVSSTTVATVTPNRQLPVELRGVATTSWAWARNTFTGLSHLEGQTVNILADGLTQPQQVVASGAITIDPPAAKVHVGLPITYDGETLDVSIQGVEPINAKKKTIPVVRMMVNESRSLWAGRDFDHLFEVKPRSTENYDAPPNLVTGITEVRISSNWGTSGSFCFRSTDPLPLTVLALIPEISVGGA